MTAPIPLTSEHVHALLGERFEIGAELGRGGQGVVLRAVRRRTADGTTAADPTALKVHLDPLQDERVAREIAVMERLQHPTLAKLLEHGAIQVHGHTVRFIAWEFIDGQPLSVRVASGPLDARTVAVIGRDVASALMRVWQVKVVHRDVNPKNVMLRDGDAHAVLIDLGAARHLSENTLTMTGYTWGTLGYMSPEQAGGDPQLTCLSDVFSLGVTMLEALTARHPTNRRQDLLGTQDVRASLLVPGAPEALTRLIDQMLERRPAGRPLPDKIVDVCSAVAATPPA